jgi:hypothetical protein
MSGDDVEKLGVAPIGAEFQVGEGCVGGDEDFFGGEWGREAAPEGAATGESLENFARVPHLYCVSFLTAVEKNAKRATVFGEQRCSGEWGEDEKVRFGQIKWEIAL